jgi:hypothetical protein
MALYFYGSQALEVPAFRPAPVFRLVTRFFRM